MFGLNSRGAMAFFAAATALRSDRNILNCPVIGFLDDAPRADQVPKPPSQP